MNRIADAHQTNYLNFPTDRKMVRDDSSPSLNSAKTIGQTNDTIDLKLSFIKQDDTNNDHAHNTSISTNAIQSA